MRAFAFILSIYPMTLRHLMNGTFLLLPLLVWAQLQVALGLTQ